MKYLGPTPWFLYLKNSDIFTQIQQNDPLRHPRWLVSDTHMHQFHENMFLLILI